jgi:hypothetical protein
MCTGVCALVCHELARHKATRSDQRRFRAILMHARR